MAIAEKTGQEVQEKRIEVPPTITVRDLAESMNISPIEIIKVLMSNGIMANINQGD
jgi:translation initiation factor IF-2